MKIDNGEFVYESFMNSHVLANKSKSCLKVNES